MYFFYINAANGLQSPKYWRCHIHWYHCHWQAIDKTIMQNQVSVKTGSSTTCTKRDTELPAFINSTYLKLQEIHWINCKKYPFEMLSKLSQVYTELHLNIYTTAAETRKSLSVPCLVSSAMQVKSEQYKVIYEFNSKNTYLKCSMSVQSSVHRITVQKHSNIWTY